ncbi:hypothetical protein [Celerinatantimonas sp. YJH-8]|uniref:hypothetical protein n=1 Tax=Celerinatantimonas sp. YJH-8 TaxID=3228714 RepID=UPI0038C45BB0
MSDQKHSGVGIASFIISIVTAVFSFLFILIAGVVSTLVPGGLDRHSGALILIGLFVIIFIFSELVALGLGIAGLCQRDRNKIFAILGTVFSVVALLITMLLALIG